MDDFRADYEADMETKTSLDREALRLKSAGVVKRAHKSGQIAPDFELPDFAGNQFSLAQLRNDGPVALVFYRGLW